jgi:hypothetical protein
MKTILAIRVVLDVVEDVFRDIEIAADAPLTHLHAATLDAFGWHGDEMASFYRSNANWDRGEEIPLMAMPEGFEEEDADMDFEELDLSASPKRAKSMDAVSVGELLVAVNDRAVYVYDFLRMWCFYVELVDQKAPEAEAQYPRLTAEYGVAPAPESREIDLGDFGDIDAPGEPDSTGDPELDAYMADGEDDDEPGGYTSLDDLDQDFY